MSSYWLTICMIALYIIVQNGNAKFHCDTPEEWLMYDKSFIPGAKWPNGLVKYELHSSITEDLVPIVQSAIDDIQNKTCIRFQTRSFEELSYILIERDDTVCGIANGCRLGIPQSVKFGIGCADKNAIIHEIGHALCLGHEHTRKDRDDYIHFDGCPPGEPPPGKDNYDTRGHFYDYTSQMSYSCGWCPGGWPKMEGVEDWQCANSDGLSVLDADKLNDFYDCGGCHGYRWRQIDQLTEQDKRGMIKFGETDEGSPLYLCRGYMGGAIVSGKYWDQSRTCYLPYNGYEYQLQTNAQVFIFPVGKGVDGMQYQVKRINQTNIQQARKEKGFFSIPTGRKANSVPCYGASELIEQDGHSEWSIGVVCEDDWDRAYFPFWGREVVSSTYGVIGCGYS
ncbi:Zinc metalloproteinase nas-14 [Orchesella cincta]|uniref:Metalloendopeptidase n=1 Tax=Orchesella cincta TaxID=48709 RepID=A0A1D2M9X0_ORCCI|nr:Zinc metalloproteinase nas-14 [Orchesella cincta]